jgi:hypothetical protein
MYATRLDSHRWDEFYFRIFGGQRYKLRLSNKYGICIIQFTLVSAFVCKCYETIFRNTKLNSVAYSSQANYTDRAAAACRRR